MTTSVMVLGILSIPQYRPRKGGEYRKDVPPPPAKIGLLSDSHGEVARTRMAVAMLRDHGSELIIHLGDIGSEAVLEELLGAHVRVVFGNCDDERTLAHYAGILGIPVDHPGASMEISSGGRLAYTHGHLSQVTHELMHAEKPTVLAHGHSHEIRDEFIDGIHVVNPGALHRAGRYTVAVLYADEDRLEILQLPRQG